jgi:hypothetical protein
LAVAGENTPRRQNNRERRQRQVLFALSLESLTSTSTIRKLRAVYRALLQTSGGDFYLVLGRNVIVEKNVPLAVPDIPMEQHLEGSS